MGLHLTGSSLTGLSSTFARQDAAPVSVMSYGALGDGSTDDTAAFAAAITAAGSHGKVVAPYTSGGYAIATSLTLSGVSLEGIGKVTLKATGSTRGTAFINVGTNGRLAGFNITNAASHLTGPIISVLNDGAVVEDNVVDGNDVSNTFGCQLNDGTTNARVRRNTFQKVYTGVIVSYANDSSFIEDNLVDTWHQHGIYVIGDATRVTNNLRIVRNRVLNHVTGGGLTSTYPITMSGVDALHHTKTVIRDNIVIGPGMAYTAATRGTPDQIALFFCDDFEVVGNVSTDGGDMGITLDGHCNRGVVSKNICLRNDTGGMDFGSVGYSTPVVSSVAISGNVCLNNGQNRNSDRNAEARVGIRLKNANGISVTGNVTGDDQGSKTQQYGSSVAGSTLVGYSLSNVNNGNNLGMYLDNGGNSGVTGMTSSSSAADWTLPTGFISQSIPRNVPITNTLVALATGRLTLAAIYLNAGDIISNITFWSGSTALATGTNQWFALYSSALALLRVTTDDTSTAWGVSSAKTLALASSYTVPASGLYYAGIMVAATTVPNLSGVAQLANAAAQSPKMAGSSTTGLTNPASAPSTAGALTSLAMVPYVEVA